MGRRAVIVLIVIVALLVVLRALMPWELKRIVNTRLSRIPGYTGRVERVGVQLWHGGYSMHGVTIRKSTGKVSEPFVDAKSIYFSIAYRELIRGKLVSDIEVEQASLNFVRGPSPETSQLEADKRWQDVITDLFPIKITHFKARDSRIRFVDTTTKPKVDVAVEHMDLQADGLRNRPEARQGPYPARIIMKGQAPAGARVEALVLAEPLAAQPHFKLSFSLSGLNLPALNDFMMAYGNVDVGGGTFDAYVEATGADGSFAGYVKPFFKDVVFKSRTDEEKNPWQRIWKAMVAATAQLIKNKSQNQIATLVPFSGKFENGGTSVEFWRTLGNLLHNGFIQALKEGLEGSPRAKKSSDTASPPKKPAEPEKNAEPPPK